MKDVYQTLKRLFQKLGLSEAESEMAMMAHVCPGLLPLELGRQCRMKKMSTYRTLDTLLEKRFLRVEKDRLMQSRKIFPADLSEIASRVDQRSRDLNRFAGELEDLCRYLRYPLTSPAGLLEVHAYYGEDAKEAFYDLHYSDWSMTQFLGDFDTQVRMIGMDFERPWYLKRLKQGRKAEGVFSRYGEITQELVKHDRREMRTSVFVPEIVQGDWFNIFPEINTVIQFRHPNPEDASTWHLLKIVSAGLTKFFSHQVSSALKNQHSQILGTGGL